MTDNTEREAFEKVYALSPFNDRLTVIINTARWEGFQLGRAQDAGVRKDWVSVPREPTEKMIDVGNTVDYTAPTHRPAKMIYQAMIAAMPTGSET